MFCVFLVLFEFLRILARARVNESLMKSLQDYDGVLYDYVHRISDTVNDDKTVTINAELLRFFQLNEQKYFPKVSDKESRH